MWAEVLACRSPLKTRLRSPIKAPLPDLPQALQRADIAASQTPRAAPLAAKFDEIWQLLGNELSQWKLPGISNFRGPAAETARVRAGSEFYSVIHAARC
jgi:hypothetical protein